MPRFCGGKNAGDAIATLNALINIEEKPNEAMIMNIVSHKGTMETLFRVAVHSSAGDKVKMMANVTVRQLYSMNPASLHASHPGQVGLSFDVAPPERGSEYLEYDSVANILRVSNDLLVPAQLALAKDL